ARRTKKQNVSSTKSAKESKDEALDAIFQPGIFKSVNLNVAANHANGKVIAFQLRALRVLRGNFPPISSNERKNNRAEYPPPSELNVSFGDFRP
ncbi:MAG: hypothetical protein WCH39_27850, partial [Schlesneria sp.]